jgi:hypothetical protein
MGWLGMQGLGLGVDLTTYTPGFAAAGIIALLSPLYLAILPVISPVRLPSFLSAAPSSTDSHMHVILTSLIPC